MILHQYASEVIEYCYSLMQPGAAPVKAKEVFTSAENKKARENLLYSFYGQYFLLMKIENIGHMNLKQFVQEKP